MLAGSLDLGAATKQPERLLPFSNSGSGIFVPGQVIGLGDQTQPVRVVAGDLGGDGDTDAVVDTSVSGFEYALESKSPGGGTFSNLSPFPIGALGDPGDRGLRSRP